MTDDRKPDNSSLPDEDGYLKDEFIVQVPKKKNKSQKTEDKRQNAADRIYAYLF